MIRRLFDEVARPNGVASLLLVSILACEYLIFTGAVEWAYGMAALLFLCGGYAGALWANWGGRSDGERG